MENKIGNFEHGFVPHNENLTLQARVYQLEANRDEAIKYAQEAYPEYDWSGHTQTAGNAVMALCQRLSHFRQMTDSMEEVLLWCDDFFTSRDKMNAQIHCAPMRLSPLTERVQVILNDYRRKFKTRVMKSTL